MKITHLNSRIILFCFCKLAPFQVHSSEHDRIWKHCKHQARRLVSKIIKLCSASKTTFRAWFYRTDPQNIEGQFGTLSGFLRTLFKSERAKKSPEIYFRPKSFRTIFEKRTPVYSFAAPLLGLAKSIYYAIQLSDRLKKQCILIY